MHRSNLFIALLILLCMNSLTNSCQADTMQEYRIKAGYLLNIPMFTEWPPAAMQTTHFTICIIGSTPLADPLESMKDKRIKNHPLAVKIIKEPSNSDGCHVLFISGSERYRLQRLLPDAHNRGIMTISDMRDFSKQGGMVTLVNLNGKIGFDLNLAEAKAASISFNSQLLRLANDVTR